MNGITFPVILTLLIFPTNSHPTKKQNPPKSLNLPYFLKTFANCTVTFIHFANFTNPYFPRIHRDLPISKSPNHLILTYSASEKMFLPPPVEYQSRLSNVKKSRHTTSCRVTLLLQPERAPAIHLFLNLVDLIVTNGIENSHIYVDDIYNLFTSEPVIAEEGDPHHIIWIIDRTTELYSLIKPAISYLLKRKNALLSVNIYLFDVESLEFEQINNYYFSIPLHLNVESEWSGNLPCLTDQIAPTECRDLLDLNEEHISRYNEWMWVPGSLPTSRYTSYERLEILREFYYSGFFDRMHDFSAVITLLRKISFEEFLGVLLLPNVTQHFSVTILINPRAAFDTAKNTLELDLWHPVIILSGSQSYNFLSCFGLQRDRWAVYVMPFDKLTWILIAVCVIVICILIEFSPDACLSLSLTNMINLAAASMEISVFIRRTPHWFATYLIWLWVGNAIILTNWYKTVFTSDVVMPYATYANW